MENDIPPTYYYQITKISSEKKSDVICPSDTSNVPAEENGVTVS